MADSDILGQLQPTPSEGRHCHGSAGTTMLYHLRVCHWTHSLSVVTTGRLELLDHGHRRHIRRGRSSFRGLQAGRSSERTKPEYTSASGRHDHATFRSGPTRQSDDRDSEPDYLLRPTRQAPGGTLIDYIAFLFSAGQHIAARDRTRIQRRNRSTTSPSQVGVILNRQ